MELARRGISIPGILILPGPQRSFCSTSTPWRRDLRIPAGTLLYASILLRMKSDSMEGQKEVADEEPGLNWRRWGRRSGKRRGREHPSPPPVRRRTKRPVTLEELISELKKAEMVGRRKP